jgi:hypothetical protein
MTPRQRIDPLHLDSAYSFQAAWKLHRSFLQNRLNAGSFGSVRAQSRQTVGPLVFRRGFFHNKIADRSLRNRFGHNVLGQLQKAFAPPNDYRIASLKHAVHQAAQLRFGCSDRQVIYEPLFGLKSDRVN